MAQGGFAAHSRTMQNRLPRVALIEDSLPIRQRLKSLIEESGSAVVVGESSTVAGALDLVRTLAPGAVVLDLQLADGTGYAVLTEIKRSHPACVVIVMTNFARDEYRERCRALGADHFLEKSNEFEQVPVLLENLRADRRLYALALQVSAPAPVPNARTLSSEHDSSGHHFRNLLDAIPAAVYTCDTEGRIAYYNAAAVALWGREPDLEHDRWCGAWRILTVDGVPLPHAQCPMAIAIREHRSLPGHEILAERPDGSRAHVRVHPQPLRDAAGTLTGAVNLMVDVTAERRAAQAVADSEMRLTGIVDSAMDAIVTVDADRRILMFNQAAGRMFACTAAAVIGRRLEALLPRRPRALPGDHGRIVDIVRICARVRGRAGRVKVRRIDGVEFPVEASISRLELQGGPIFTIIMRDISERVRIEGESAQLGAALERFNRLAVSRERRMIELKLVINDLSARLGMETPFALAFLNNIAVPNVDAMVATASVRESHTRTRFASGASA